MLRAGFIGIDKHNHPHIRDLVGARRDATALWALFSDTVPDIKAELLINTKATIEGIRRVLDDTLGSAAADDIVILTFSGHGTRTNRLVAYDSSLEALDET